MSIELIVILGVVVIALIYAVNRGKGVDVNNDGKVDFADAKAAVSNTVDAVKDAVDLNDDGKINLTDAKVAADAVASTVDGAVAEAKRTVSRAKTKAKKVKAAAKLAFDEMTKKDLLAHAKENGVKANASMNKDAIIEAIKNAD